MKITNIIKCQSIIRKFLVLHDYYNIIYRFWNKYLKKYEVKMPKYKTAFDYALRYLYKYRNNEIYINDIKNYVTKNGIKLTGSDSLQIRHLALQYGFNILKGNEINPINGIKLKKSHFMLINLFVPHPSYINIKKYKNLDKNIWNKILITYEYKCACCGNEEGKPMRFNKYKICKLQKGHMNPTKKLDIYNIIPQCENCNQQYKNKAIFNKRGYVIDYNKNGFII